MEEDAKSSERFEAVSCGRARARVEYVSKVARQRGTDGKGRAHGLSRAEFDAVVLLPQFGEFVAEAGDAGEGLFALGVDDFPPRHRVIVVYGAVEGGERGVDLAVEG